MSRIGKKPIQIPGKTKVSYSDRTITVQGEKGSLSGMIHPAVELNIKDGILTVSTLSDDIDSMALQGLTRSLVNNMIIGVNRGFERVLEINGIGYRAEMKGKSLVLNLGFSHPVTYDLPPGIDATVEKNTVIKLSGMRLRQ
jgi:large subunit ribosomal protein L6